MAISFKCDQCGAKVKVADKYAGRAGKCPSCEAKVRVPETSAEPETPSPPPKPKRSGRSTPAGDPEPAPMAEFDEPASAPEAAFDFGSPMDIREELQPPKRGRKSTPPSTPEPTPPADAFAFEEEPLTLEEDQPFEAEEPVAGTGGYRTRARQAPRGRGGRTRSVGSWHSVAAGFGFVRMAVVAWALFLLLSAIMGVIDATSDSRMDPGVRDGIRLGGASLMFGGGVLALIGRLPLMRAPGGPGSPSALWVVGAAAAALLCYGVPLVAGILALADEPAFVMAELGDMGTAFAWLGAEAIFVGYLGRLAENWKSDPLTGAKNRFVVQVGSLALVLALAIVAVGFLLMAVGGGASRPQGLPEGFTMPDNPLGESIAVLARLGQIVPILVLVAVGVGLVMYYPLIGVAKAEARIAGGDIPGTGRRDPGPSRAENDDVSQDEEMPFEDEEPAPPPKGKPRYRR